MALADNMNEFDMDNIPIDDEVRTFACSISPNFALLYAQYVDKGPHDITRTIACGDFTFALWYAREVDMKPCDETRLACLKDSWSSFRYAWEVDKCPRPDTREVAYREEGYKRRYIEEFGE